MHNGGTPVIGYYLERQTNQSDKWLRVSRNTIPGTTYDLSDLIEGTEYRYRVIAVNKKGESEPSEASQPFICKPQYSTPSEPNGLRVTETTKAYVDLSWRIPNTDGGSPITSYIVEFREAGVPGPWIKANLSNLLETSYRLTGVKEGKYYDIRVSAENAAGVGPPAEIKGDSGSSRSTPGKT